MSSILAARKAAFIFNYLRDSHCEITTTWDDDMDFVQAFLRAFPDRTGTVDDTALDRAAKRLYVVCKQLVEDGWLDRWVLPNSDLADPRREPRWQYVYALAYHTKRDLKDRGATSEVPAARWSGIALDRIIAS
jgi:hypothetical protein